MGDYFYFDWADTKRAIAASVEDEALRRREAEELEAALAASAKDATATDQRVMFLGGGRRVDVNRRARFSEYGCFTAGNHEGADVRGDWSKSDFWAKIKARQPRAIVIDSGSESWLSTSREGIDRLKSYLSEKEAVLMYSPHPDSGPLWTLTSQHYNVVMYQKRHLLFTFWAGLPKRPGPRPSELVFQIQDCETGMMTPEERRRCYGSLSVFENVDSFDDAVAQQLRQLFSS